MNTPERNQCPHCGYWKLVGERCKCQPVTRYCAACDTQYSVEKCPLCARTEEESWVHLREVEAGAKALADQSARTGQVGGDWYRKMVIQPAEFCTKNNLGFLAGCVVKRVCRYRDKNGREDLEKAIHELQLLIELEYGG